jgi:hypothetical protein
VKEYEPLFKDDEDEPRASTAPATTGLPEKQQPKRPDTARHYFPSRDVWEDVPDSLNYVTTVETPQLPDDSDPAAEHEPKGVYEPPEAEEARKEVAEDDQEDFLRDQTKGLAKQRFKPEVVGDVPIRPGVRHRFPSQDVWEESPSSVMHTTTIHPEDEEPASPVEAKQPEVPVRPTKKSAEEETAPAEARQAPGIPGRPKPQVPARPSKLRGSDASEEAPLAKSTSKELNEGANAAPAPKAKPAVPARPGGSKIAALQANFMSDLNKKLGLGPQAPKKEEAKEPEAEEEKAPLADARKGRARGPQRRRPGVSPSGAAEEARTAPTSAPSRPIFKFTISRPQTIWEVDEGVLSVPVSAPTAETAKAVADAAEKGIPAEIHIVTEEKAADADVPPVTEETAVEKVPTNESTKGVEAAVQTGETKLETTDAETGETEKAIAYVGGKAPEEGSVVVTEDGKEHISN